jgi:hypothetical protein
LTVVKGTSTSLETNRAGLLADRRCVEPPQPQSTFESVSRTSDSVGLGMVWARSEPLSSRSLVARETHARAGPRVPRDSARAADRAAQ